MTINQDQTEKILQELLGFENITDKELLRKMILDKMNSLSKVEKLTLDLKVGQKIKEIENSEYGVKSSDKKIKITTIVSLAIFSFIGFWLPIKYDLLFPLKIAIFLFATFWGLSALRATYTFIKK